jgi:hypothetical protein
LITAAVAHAAKADARHIQPGAPQFFVFHCPQ